MQERARLCCPDALPTPCRMANSTRDCGYFTPWVILLMEIEFLLMNIVRNNILSDSTLSLPYVLLSTSLSNMYGTPTHYPHNFLNKSLTASSFFVIVTVLVYSETESIYWDLGKHPMPDSKCNEIPKSGEIYGQQCFCIEII